MDQQNSNTPRRPIPAPTKVPIPADEVRVGGVAGMFGIRGEVKVHPEANESDRLGQYTALTARFADGSSRVLVPTSARTHKTHLIMRFEDVETANDAEELRGAALTIPLSERGPLPEDTYYITDLVGMTVHTTDGEEIGPITEVLELPANDVYVTSRGMIPAVKQFVREVNLEQRRVVVQPVPGLFEPAKSGE